MEFSYYEGSELLSRLSNYEQNGLVQFLCGLFPNDANVNRAIAKYWVGTHMHQYGAYTLFPYLDDKRQFCRGKLIRYNSASGRRLKGNYDTSELASVLGLKGFRFKRTCFGEHLLPANPRMPVAIVESEKSAIIGSICEALFPDMIWLASGGKGWLTVETILRVGQGRAVILFPDADGFNVWYKLASEANRRGANVTVSRLIETRASTEEQSAGWDIADYLVREQSKINAYNFKVERYNSYLDSLEASEAEQRGMVELG